MQINTDAPILHDCRCGTSKSSRPHHEFYKGFLIHRWNGGRCLIPLEIPTKEAGNYMMKTPIQHWSAEEKVSCLYFKGPGSDRIYTAIDRFWAAVQAGLAQPAPG
ncbi:hypothetical protein LCGC14_0312980 [marine sediment metagenome]|uniref:Uncharacterized protein n=1 Tax=marine sediment metagenome TaxID=412755 RepID=A0A0F9W8N0_9ZZZZ